MNNPIKRRRVCEIRVKTTTKSNTDNVLESESKVEMSTEEMGHKVEEPSVKDCIPSQSNVEGSKLKDDEANNKANLREWYEKTIDRETAIEDNPPRRV